MGIRATAIPVIALLVLSLTFLERSVAARQEPALSVRITSPLGRTGLSGAIRIVAQVRQEKDAPYQYGSSSTRHCFGRSTSRPMRWNGRTRTRLTDARSLSKWSTPRATRPVTEWCWSHSKCSKLPRSQASWLRHLCRTREADSSKGCPRETFTLLEDGVPQALDLVNQEAVSATFALLVDSSNSMSPRMDFVHLYGDYAGGPPWSAGPDDYRAVLQAYRYDHWPDK